VNVRFLAASDADDLRARFGGALSEHDAEALSAVAEARILVVDGLADGLAGALRAGGATVVKIGTASVLATTRTLLAEIAAQTPAARAVLDALSEALRRAAAPAPRLRMRERSLDLRDEACVMGIVNVTPDSFYDRVAGVDAAVAKAAAMAADGAALVDVGGQSYAHWNARISADDERARVVPAIAAIAAAGIDVALSVDTVRASVASAALDAGAHLINDCSGLSEPALAETVAAHDAGLVVMHLKGVLNERDPGAYRYDDALAEIVAFLHERTERAVALGVARDAIAVDPGLEFGKEPATDLEILDRFGELRALGYPILFASSRKSFIGRIFDRPARDLLVPSLATAAIGIAAGARLLRVHDVRETVQLARMLAAATPRRRRALQVAARMPGTPAAPGNSPDVRAV
jgi:dihydropteroate synthase